MWGFYYCKAQSICMQPLVSRWYHLRLPITHPWTKIPKCSVADSHFSFLLFSFVHVQTAFTASLKQGACRKSKPLLCFLQSIKQYLQQTSTLPAWKLGNKWAWGLTIQSPLLLPENLSVPVLLTGLWWSCSPRLLFQVNFQLMSAGGFIRNSTSS